MSSPSPDITFYFLGASRAIRVAWALEELSLPYKLINSPRASNGLASPEFKAQIPSKLGKSPTIKDGNVVVQESGAIIDYLCERYDKSNHLLPADPAKRAKVREWMYASEGTFLVHALAILYARWRLPEAAKASGPEMERAMSVNVHNDLNWLESELEAGNGEFLVGDSITAADVMVQFSIQFMFARKLGTDGGSWPAVQKWLKGTESVPAYLAAVEKTGYSL